jgi:hypothetical protein
MVQNFIPEGEPITIYEDNEGTISQANNNIMNKATRTIALKFHYIREEIEAKRICLTPVASQDQLGDLLTKSLGSVSFSKLRNLVMGTTQWDPRMTCAMKPSDGRQTISNQIQESKLNQEAASSTTSTAQKRSKQPQSLQ